MSDFNTCITCGEKFSFSEIEKNFLKKFGVPEPEECFNCQLKHMMAFWPSVGKWHSRKCDFSGETIITNYSANSRFPVYKKEYFSSDKWEAPFLELDMNKSFFAQMKELQEKTPRPHQLGDNLENCLFCDDARSSKNCYLSSSFLECEDFYYSYRCVRCKSSTDLFFCWDCSLSTNLVFSRNCFKVSHSIFINDSSESLFLYDCQNVKNCFMCWNLRNSEYCIRNKKYSKEEYYKQLKKYDFGSRKQIEDLQKEFEENIRNEAYHPENRNIACENVTGNFLTNSKNLKNAFFIEESENGVNLFRGRLNNNSMNLLSILEGDSCYLTNLSAYLHNVKFSSFLTRCSNSEYLDNCVDLEYCFGCVGLKNKKYCILNKQYTKQEYEELLPKIKLKMREIGEYGRFFPYSMMYTEYNSTIARIYFPDTKENIEKLGGYYENNNLQIINIKDDLPDNIKNLEGGVETVCIKTGKKFNYIAQVVELHKKMNLPLFSVFHIDRIVENFKYFQFKEYISKSFISGEPIKHYYSSDLGYKKIISNDEYNKIVNS